MLILVAGAVLVAFVCGCWCAEARNPYLDVGRSFWTLHVWRRREALQVEAVLRAVGLPIAITDAGVIPQLAAAASNLGTAVLGWSASVAAVLALEDR